MWPTDTRHVSNDYSHPFPSPSFRRPSSLPLSYSAVAVQIPVPLPPPLLPIPPFILFPTQQYRAPHRPTAAPPLGAMAAARPSCRLRAAVGVKVPSAALLSDHPPSPGAPCPPQVLPALPRCSPPSPGAPLLPCGSAHCPLCCSAVLARCCSALPLPLSVAWLRSLGPARPIHQSPSLVLLSCSHDSLIAHALPFFPSTSPLWSMHHHAPPCTTMRHHAPPCTTMHHHAPPCTTISIAAAVLLGPPAICR
ncbi:unnamed protein product [Closterium sp. NIES-53]